MKAALDDLTHAIETFDSAIAMVTKQPRGPKRWRAANNLWLSLSFQNQKIYREVCDENRISRETVDKFGQQIGLTKAQKADKTLRNCLNIPVGAYIAIGKADPTTFTEKSNSVKFFKTFPEYTTRGVF